MYRTPIAYNPFARLKMALKSQKRKRSSIVLGITATLLASLSFTFMSACARMLEPMASGEMTFFRGLFGLLFIPLLSLESGEPFYTGKFKGFLSLLGLFGSIALFFYFLSIEGLTLGDAQILSQLAAFFMCLMAPYFFPKSFRPRLSQGWRSLQQEQRWLCKSGITAPLTCMLSMAWQADSFPQRPISLSATWRKRASGLIRKLFFIFRFTA